VDTALALSVVLGALIGLALGLFGGGGSILAVPVLVYVGRLAPAAAVASSLAIVGATSSAAAYVHQRRGHVRPSVGAVFGGAGIVTALLGARLTPLVPERVLMLAFAGLMVVVGGLMLARPHATSGQEDVPREPRLVRAVLAGAAVGGLTGFLGVGGGFLVVPALIAFAGLDMRTAVGTSLVVIAINSGAGFIGHAASRLDYRLIGMLTAGAVLGALAGERLARRVSTEKLRRGFALFVIAVGALVAASGSPGG
jgi:uncharacterized membrane protein YfcA